MRTLIAVLKIGSALGLVGCGPHQSDFESFGAYQAPDNMHTLVLDIAPGRTVYGPAILRLSLRLSDLEIPKYTITTKIANDGGQITNANIQVTWTSSEKVRLCLSGVEQEDKVLEIDVESLSHSVTVSDCAKS